MDDVCSQWKNLSLTEREVIEHDFASTAVVEGAALVAKLFTKRRVNLEAVARTLKGAWKTEQSFELRDLGENKAIILFEDEVDMDRVLSMGPWSFDKYLIALHKLGDEEQIENISFDSASFWIQIHDLPARRMTKEVGVRIGNTLGEVEEVDIPARGILLGKCIRVRVKIDITQPLCRGRLVKFGGPSSTWVSFRYERLPIFCYWCGKLNHDERDCGVWIRSKGSLQQKDQQYGAWLRASYDRLQRPQRVLVNTRGSSKAKETNGEPTKNRAKDNGDGETSMSSATEMMEMVPTPMRVNDQLVAGTATENPGKSTWATKETCGVEKVLKTDDGTGKSVILETDLQDTVTTKSCRESESKSQNTGGNDSIIGGLSNRDNGLQDSNGHESNQMGQVEEYNSIANQPMGNNGQESKQMGLSRGI